MKKKKSEKWFIRFVLRHEAQVLCEEIAETAAASDPWEAPCHFCVICGTKEGAHHFTRGVCPGCEDATAEADDPITNFYKALYKEGGPF